MDRYRNNNKADVLDALNDAIPEENITIWRYEDFSQLQPKILKSITELENINKLISN